MKNMEEYPCGNCVNCPLVKELVEAANGLRTGAEAIGAAALGEGPEILAERFFESIPEGASMLDPDGEIKPLESPEDIMRGLRANATTFLEGLDARREEIARDIAAITEDCDGPLKMRAKKAGQVVTVTVCVSPEAPQCPSSEKATVDRKHETRG